MALGRVHHVKRVEEIHAVIIRIEDETIIILVGVRQGIVHVFIHEGNHAEKKVEDEGTRFLFLLF